MWSWHAACSCSRPPIAAGSARELLLSSRAQFDLARRVRAPPGAPLGEVFTFLSGLYFRGKLAYAAAFARPPPGLAGAYVITPSEGLRPARRADGPGAAAPLREGRRSTSSEPRYRRPLERDSALLAAPLPPGREVILLGSVATGKYVEVLGDASASACGSPPPSWGAAT